MNSVKLGVIVFETTRAVVDTHITRNTFYAQTSYQASVAILLHFHPTLTMNVYNVTKTNEFEVRLVNTFIY